MSDHRLLIIGQGSIGRRHAMVGRDLGYQTATVSRRIGKGDFATVADALSEFAATAVVIASATVDHMTDLRCLRECGYSGPVLVEKPLAVALSDAADLEDDRVHVAYNLRFSSVVQRLSARLAALDEPVVAAQFLVGQYLPDWRPGQDWQNGYSADAARGGGVLRDLSHELDLALQFFGPFRRLTALGGALSDLPMTADDVWQISAVASRCPVVALHMNALDRAPVRRIRVNTTNCSISADLIGGVLSVNGRDEAIAGGVGESYRGQLRAFVEGTDASRLCTLREATEVMKVIDAVERAAKGSAWVEMGAS